MVMALKKGVHFLSVLGILLLFCSSLHAQTHSEQFKGKIYNPGQLKPVDSITILKVGDRAPNFTLPSMSGDKISLRQYRGEKNVVISFVPAAWTPVCSDQWPGYNIAKSLFDKKDAILLGITVDNIPTLYAWTNEMGELWFPVLSDFWPHGETSKRYGVLRSDGVSERAIFIIDKQGIIRYIDIHNINERPRLEVIVKELDKLEK
jgi:peroxiredoxin (alkyl hydroperoxide reductase subunit C)